MVSGSMLRGASWKDILLFGGLLVSMVSMSHAGEWRHMIEQSSRQVFQEMWPNENSLRLDEMTGMPEWLTLGLEHRTRYETFNHQFRQNSLGSDQQIALRTRLQVGINYKLFRFHAEFQDSRAHLEDDGSVIDATHVNENDLLQLYVGLGSRNVLGTGLPSEFKVGRLTMDFGKRRLIARNQFRNTTNAFTGIHWSLGDVTKWQFRAFLVQPVRRFLTKPDTEDHRSFLGGVFLNNQQIPMMKFDVYTFYLDEDDRQRATHSQRRKLSTSGLRIFKTSSKGEFDYEVESVWQVGDSAQTTGSQTTLSHFTHFQHAEIGYTFDLPWSPRLLLQYDYASGDQDPNDHQNERFDTLFGARRFEFGPIGIWGPFARSNISSPGWRIVLKPQDGVSFFFGHRLWWLAESRNQWITTGIQDPSGRSGNFLGNHLEARLRWDIMPKNIRLEGGWAYLVKGGFAKNAPDAPSRRMRLMRQVTVIQCIFMSRPS